jgi:hypothetical protein
MHCEEKELHAAGLGMALAPKKAAKEDQKAAYVQFYIIF